MMKTFGTHSPCEMVRGYFAFLILVLATCACAQQSVPPQSGFRISGTAVNSINGQPLDQVRVFLGRPQESEDSEVVITGPDGRFQFNGVPAGKYTLGAGKPGFVMQGFEQHEEYSSAIVVGPRFAADNLLFRITPAASVSGQIMDEQNEPVRDAQVMLFRAQLHDGHNSTRLGGQVNSDDRGQYRFGALPPGTYFVMISARPWYAPYTAGALSFYGNVRHYENGGQEQDESAPLNVTYPILYYPAATDSSQATPIILAAGDHATADFSLTPVRSLHIRVHTPKLNLNQGYSVVLVPQGFQGVSVQMPVSVQSAMLKPGEIEISGVPPGQYRLQMVFPGKQTTTLAQVIDVENDIELDASTAGQARDISGTMRMQDGGRLPPGAHIILRNTASGESARAPVLADGHFQFRVHEIIPPGTYAVAIGAENAYLVSVSATGARVLGRDVEIRDSGAIRLNLVASQGIGHIDGTAVSADGKPIAGAMVLLAPDDIANNAVLIRRDQSDGDGTFTLPNVVPGHYTLLAIHNGWDLEWMNPAVLKPFLAGGEQVVVQRNGKYSLKVRVQ